MTRSTKVAALNPGNEEIKISCFILKSVSGVNAYLLLFLG